MLEEGLALEVDALEVDALEVGRVGTVGKVELTLGPEAMAMLHMKQLHVGLERVSEGNDCKILTI